MFLFRWGIKEEAALAKLCHEGAILVIAVYTLDLGIATRKCCDALGLLKLLFVQQCSVLIYLCIPE